MTAQLVLSDKPMQTAGHTSGFGEKADSNFPHPEGMRTNSSQLTSTIAKTQAHAIAARQCLGHTVALAILHIAERFA